MNVASKNRIKDSVKVAIQTRGELTPRQAMRAAFVTIRSTGCIETGCKLVWRQYFRKCGF